jgi:hypothetical protein
MAGEWRRFEELSAVRNVRLNHQLLGVLAHSARIYAANRRFVVI